MKTLLYILIPATLFGGIVFFFINRQNDQPSQTNNLQAEEKTPDTSQVYNITPSEECPETLTPSQTEGPYFTPSSPERIDIREGAEGTQLVVTGIVFDQNCVPVSNAKIDFWQAGNDGKYDNEGYRLRGHQFTDENGMYVLNTIVPLDYENRPPHIHLKISVDEKEILTSQLYFPEEENNTSDTIFAEDLVMNVQKTPDGWIGKYNFKIDVN